MAGNSTLFRMWVLLTLAARAGHVLGQPDQLDVVSMALKVSCVNRRMVDSLDKFLQPRPRRFHIVAPKGCDRFERYSSKVRCYLVSGRRERSPTRVVGVTAHPRQQRP